MLIGWIFGMYETFSIWRMLLMLSISRRHGSKSHHRQKAWLIRRHGKDKDINGERPWRRQDCLLQPKGNCRQLLTAGLCIFFWRDTELLLEAGREMGQGAETCKVSYF